MAGNVCFNFGLYFIRLLLLFNYFTLIYNLNSRDCECEVRETCTIFTKRSAKVYTSFFFFFFVCCSVSNCIDILYCVICVSNVFVFVFEI